MVHVFSYKDKHYIYDTGSSSLHECDGTAALLLREKLGEPVDTSAVTVITTSDSIATWIQNNIKDPCTFAYNPWCHSISEVDYWNRSLKRHTFVADEKELLGPRLTGKETNFFEHEIEFAGISIGRSFHDCKSILVETSAYNPMA